MRSKLLVLVWFLFVNSFAVSQDQTAGRLQELGELDLARDLLETTEEELGRYSLDLVEPIEQLANRLMSLNQFEEADEMLDRAVQITRINNGLHTPAQLALIRKRIDNAANRGNWDDAREQMDYLFTYYLRVPVLLNESLLDDFMILTNQHLRGATEDEGQEQGRHLSRVYQLNWAMVATARKLYGNRSPQIVPYLYRQVQHIYSFKKGRDDGGRARTNDNFYYQLNGRTSGWPKISTKNRFYRDGLRILVEIRGIYADQELDSAEAQAMSEIYIGDWFMLFDHADLAAESYESAYTGLVEAEVSLEDIDSLLSVPRILPLQNFYADVGSAIDQLPVSNVPLDGEDVLTHELSFDEWSVDYPTLRSPLGSYNRNATESHTALYSFQLLAENESTFLYKHRFRQSMGIPVDVDLVEGFRGLPMGRELALERFEQLRFRPKMVNGKAVESRGMLRYSIAAED